MFGMLRLCFSVFLSNRVDVRVPIVGEQVFVPLRLVEATTIDGPNPAVHAVHAELVWRQSDDAAKSLMGSMYCSNLKASVPLPEYPGRGYATGEVRIWYLRKWRKKGWK